jgi:hypothetical protein
MTVGLAFAILGFAALAGQGGQAAANETPAQAADVNVGQAADRQLAENQTVTRSADRKFLGPGGSAVVQRRPEKPKKSTPAPAVQAQAQAQAPAQAQAQAQASAPAPAPAPAKPAEPTPVAGLNQIQMNNAKRIVEAARSMGLGKDAQVIAVATAMQESNLYNLASTALPESNKYPNEGVGSDYDSVGLFQQRTSTGWGAVKDLMKPEFATKQFLKALIRIPDWQHMPLTIAAQTVQGSAFPDAYAKHEARANQVVDEINK